MSVGKLIVLEGCEGAGKTTLIRRLHEDLNARFKDTFITTREPGGTGVGDTVRRVLLECENLEPESEFLLFMASRFQLFREVIFPALKSGKHVISDRLDASSYAYQVVGRNIELFEEIFFMLRFRYLYDHELKVIEPIYILLDVDSETGLGRVSKRGGLDRLEAESLEFHRRVRKAYKSFISHRPHHRVVDASRPEDEVYAEVLSIIEEHVINTAP